MFMIETNIINYFTCIGSMCVAIPGRLSYLGIPGYLEKGGGMCVSIPGMAKVHGNPRILG